MIIYGYDKDGKYTHTLSGDSDLVELNKRDEYQYTEALYPNDGEDRIFKNGAWVKISLIINE